MITEYETQNEFNPNIWQQGELPKRFQLALLKIAKHFHKFLEVDAPIQDITLTGSSANYNWTTDSDIDLHVLIDYKAVNKDIDLVRNLMQTKKSVWNRNYPLSYRGHDIELYAQDINEEHTSSGVYSVLHQKWIKKPNSNKVQINDIDIESKAAPYSAEIRKLSLDDLQLLNKIQTLKSKLKKWRSSGLQTNGEYSLENLAFKQLRRNGDLQRLNNLQQQAMMRDLDPETNSLGEQKDHDTVENMLHEFIKRKRKLSEQDWNKIIQDLDAVIDSAGQWAHPGRCTMIPGNQITMKRVPYYLLGIDDTGYVQIMKPEQEYSYPGTRVFEIPFNQKHESLIKHILYGKKK
jgi:hypothetical protein